MMLMREKPAEAEEDFAAAIREVRGALDREARDNRIMVEVYKFLEPVHGLRSMLERVRHEIPGLHYEKPRVEQNADGIKQAVYGGAPAALKLTMTHSVDGGLTYSFGDEVEFKTHLPRVLPFGETALAKLENEIRARAYLDGLTPQAPKGLQTGYTTAYMPSGAN